MAKRYLIPTTYEHREPLYKDVEQLLTPGFLAHSVRVCGVSLSFRSLFPSDSFLLNHRIGINGLDFDWKVWCIATCTWMVNGQILFNDPNSAYILFQYFRKLPNRSLNILFSTVMGLAQRVNLAFDGVEAFCYEDLSRYLWKQVGRQSPSIEYNCGIPGVSQLGMNAVQRMWIAFNQSEDDRLRELSAWQTGKMIASAMAPKGIERLNKQDQLHWNEEEQRRQEVQDTFFYQQIGKLERGQKVKDFKDPGREIIKARTTDELLEDMKRWVSGEMDLHDRIVAEYKAEVMRRRKEDLRKQQERLMLAQRESIRYGEDPKPLQLVGYTPEQLHEIMKDKQPVKPGVRRIYDDEWGRKEYLHNRYLSKEVSAGFLDVTPDGSIVVNEKSLNEQVAGRRVQVDPRMDPHRK